MSLPFSPWPLAGELQVPPSVDRRKRLRLPFGISNQVEAGDVS